MDLTTERLRIADISDECLDELSILSQDDEIMAYLPDFYNNAAAFKKAISDNKKCYYAVTDKISGQYYGQIGYDIISMMNEYKLCKLHFFFKKSAWGKGYATECIKALLDNMINHEAVLKIIAETAQDNTAAVKALKTCGFIVDKTSDAYMMGKKIVWLTLKITKPMYLKK